VTGVGTVAVGRVASGTLKSGDTVSLYTTEGLVTTQASSIEIIHVKKSEIKAGDLAAIALRNIKLTSIHRGLIVSDSKNPCSQVTEFTAQVYIFNHSGQLRVGYCPIYHVHTCNFSARWKAILQKLDKRTGKVTEENPSCLKQGDLGIVVITPQHPVELEIFTDFAPLGRFVIRDGGGTIGFGTIKSVVKASVKSNYTAPKAKTTFLKKQNKK